MQAAGDLIGGPGQRGQVAGFEQCQGVVGAQPLPRYRTINDRGNRRDKVDSCRASPCRAAN